MESLVVVVVSLLSGLGIQLAQDVASQPESFGKRAERERVSVQTRGQ